MIGRILTLHLLLVIVKGADSWDSSSPSYQVNYNYDNFVSRERTIELLEYQPNLNYSYELIKYDSLDYICLVPILNDSIVESGSDANELMLNDTELTKLKREEDIIVSERMKTVIGDFAARNICSIHVADYWAYEFCYNGDFTQYHYVRDGSVKDPLGPSYRLGRASKTVNDNIYEVVSNNLFTSDGDTYVSQLIGDGSICDITGKSRSTFVKYKCGKGLNQPRIESVSELKTCQYQVVVLLPELCDLEVFQSKEKLVYDLDCRIVDQDVKPPQKINFVDYRLIPLGYNLFIGITKPESPITVLITNRLDHSGKERLKESIKLAFTNAINTAQFKIPGYVLKSLSDNPNLATSFSFKQSHPLLSPTDVFIYVTKLYDFTGTFIDNVELYFDTLKGSFVTFGLDEIDNEESISNANDGEWYGTDAAADKTLPGNFIMVNGIRYHSVTS